MAMKKAAPKKAAPKAAGSDRGAKMKANEAEKRKQYVSAVLNKRSTLPLAEQKSRGYKASNDLAGGMSRKQNDFRGVGRTTQREIDQKKRRNTK
jgi:hypothetical protein